MVAWCFRAVSQRIRRGTPVAVEGHLTTAAEDFGALEAPVFVCFKKVSTNELRGCVGTFRSGKLGDQLTAYACAAAFEDSRFSPIRSIEELATLKCTVSLLHTFEKLPCGAWDDWVVGVHGIQAALTTDAASKRFHATFLPSVAKDQNWDQRTTITRLLRKSGYEGDVTAAILERIDITRYQESSFSAAYGDVFPDEDCPESNAQRKRQHTACTVH